MNINMLIYMHNKYRTFNHATSSTKDSAIVPISTDLYDDSGVAFGLSGSSDDSTGTYK
jgi:hypothetical protein